MKSTKNDETPYMHWSVQFGVVKSFGAFLRLAFYSDFCLQAMARLVLSRRLPDGWEQAPSHPDGAAVTMNTCVFHYFFLTLTQVAVAITW